MMVVCKGESLGGDTSDREQTAATYGFRCSLSSRHWKSETSLARAGIMEHIKSFNRGILGKEV